MDYIFKEAESLTKKVCSRDPFELLDFIGARVKYSFDYQPDGLQGFATIIKQFKFAVINGHLKDELRRIVAGHEAAHLIIHQEEIMLSPVKALKDFDLFNSPGKLEYQANSFLADFLLSDKDVLDAVAQVDNDYFATARATCVPPHLLAFKLFSMMRRGYAVRPPVDLESCFLKTQKSGGGNNARSSNSP